jgi:hypothetical protein
VEFEEIIHLMRAIVQASVARGMSLPKLFRVEWEGGKVLEVPGEVLRPAGGTPEKAPRPRQEEREDDDPPVVQAIFRLLYDSPKRMTGGVIGDRLTAEHEDEPGFSRKNISRTLTSLASEGRLVSHPLDPEDGMERGYGLPEWETPE